MFPAESVEQFKNRVKNGSGRGTSYRNYFATLRPVDRTASKSVDSLLTIRVRGEKRLTPKERIALLKKLL